MLVLDAFERARGRAPDLGQAGMEAFELLDPRVGHEVHLLGVAAAEDMADEVPFRRIAELGALHQLRRGEALEVEPLGELHRIGRRLERLHDHRALEVAAAGAAGHLREQLERALRGAEVGQLQREVRVDDAHQRHAREIEPLGDHLRPEEHVVAPGAEIREHLAEKVLLPHRIRVDAGHAGAREQAVDDLLHLLRAVALPADLGRAALRADRGGRLAVVAEVATRGMVGRVERQRHRTARALHGLAAIGADQRTRVPAAVEEQDRLLALAQALMDAVDQLAREHVLALRVEHLAPHVDDAEGRHRAVVDALGHRVEHVAAGLGVLPRLQRRRRRTQHARRAEERSAHDRDVAAVVHRGLALLEGRLVLLVDHDEPEVRQGREDRGARAHDHAGLAEGHRHPRVEPLAGGKVAVPDHDLGAEVGEAGAQAADRLRGQGDFRDKEDRGAAFGHDLADQSDVDLGLPRAGDAMEQVRTEGLLIEALRDGRHRGKLLRIEVMAGGRDGFRLGERVVVGHAPEHAGVLLDRARLEERIDRLLGNPEPRDQLGAVGGFLLGREVIEHLRLARGLAAQFREGLGVGQRDQREQAAEDGADAFAHRRGQDRLEDRVEPAAVVARHPFGELADIGREHRLLVLEQDDAAQLGGGRRFSRVFPDHAEARAAAERDADELADLQRVLEGRRNRIRVGPGPAVERDHLGDAGFDFAEEIGHSGKARSAPPRFQAEAEPEARIICPRACRPGRTGWAGWRLGPARRGGPGRKAARQGPGRPPTRGPLGGCPR